MTRQVLASSGRTGAQVGVASPSPLTKTMGDDPSPAKRAKTCTPPTSTILVATLGGASSCHALSSALFIATVQSPESFTKRIWDHATPTRSTQTAEGESCRGSTSGRPRRQSLVADLLRHPTDTGLCRSVHSNLRLLSILSDVWRDNASKSASRCSTAATARMAIAAMTLSDWWQIWRVGLRHWLRHPGHSLHLQSGNATSLTRDRGCDPSDNLGLTLDHVVHGCNHRIIERNTKFREDWL